MTADTMSERWGTVLDAVAYSPVRQQVRPQGLPSKITPELQATVKKLAKRVPDIAAMFGPPAGATPPKARPAPVPPPPPKPAPVAAPTPEAPAEAAAVTAPEDTAAAVTAPEDTAPEATAGEEE